MAIVGTGVDITEVARVAASIARFGERFLNRVFTPAEIAYCQSKKRGAAESFAARFAAKEAAMKAIGTGLRRGVTWHDVEVAREPGGRPTIIFSGKAAEFAAKLGMRRVSLSLTHTEHQAMAQVILED
ncbi:MAG: phosphopantetheine--protein transferase domain protein [Acidobacteriales bacterium]|nr:phosphopantetheine--protein transferase domain protein [Terriglobales bacterium]